MAVNSLVSGGCIVSGAGLRNSLLFTGVHVHSYAELDGAVVLPYVEIGRDARLSNVVIDRGVRDPARAWSSARTRSSTPSASAAPTRASCLITQPMIDRLDG